MFRNALVAALISFTFFNLTAQQQIDSLRGILNYSGTDSNTVSTLNKLSREFYLHSNYAKAKEYAEKAKNLGEKISFKKGIATAFKNIGNIYIDQGDYPQALQNELFSLKIWKEIENNYEVANTFSNIGSVYNY